MLGSAYGALWGLGKPYNAWSPPPPALEFLMKTPNLEPEILIEEALQIPF